MAAKDLFHNTVRTALDKDGWTITDENLFIQVEDVHDEFFRRRFIQRAIEEHQLKLLIFNPESEEIIRWKD